MQRWLEHNSSACNPACTKPGSCIFAKPKRVHAISHPRHHNQQGYFKMNDSSCPQDVLARHATESERRVRVVRIATTGEQPQRMVGMLIPEPAVDEVVAALSSRSAEGSGGGAAAEQAPAAGSGQTSEQAEGNEGDDQAGAVGSPAKGSTPRAAKVAGEVGSPKAGSCSGRRHHRRRHHRGGEQRPEGEAGLGSGGEDLPSPTRKRHRRKGAKAGQSEPSDRGGRGSGGEDLPSPKRKRHGRKGAKPAQPKVSDRGGGSGRGGVSLPSSTPMGRQKVEAQPRRMPRSSGRPASMKG